MHDAEANLQAWVGGVHLLLPETDQELALRQGEMINWQLAWPCRASSWPEQGHSSWPEQ